MSTWLVVWIALGAVTTLVVLAFVLALFIPVVAATAVGGALAFRRLIAGTAGL